MLADDRMFEVNTEWDWLRGKSIQTKTDSLTNIYSSLSSIVLVTYSRLYQLILLASSDTPRCLCVIMLHLQKKVWGLHDDTKAVT